ncbi:MAG TPA: glycosyltransferase [Candidatus Methylomirabilis sp.]|nr:glycosyltransferase [Candidatus Methylomirabilis sp.]
MNILVINSLRATDRALVNLFKDLNENNEFFFFSSEAEFLEHMSLPRGKIFLGPADSGWLGRWGFILFLPWLWLVYFFLWPRWAENKIDRVICLGVRAEIVFTPLANWRKAKSIWWKVPGENEAVGFLRLLEKKFSNLAEQAAFTIEETERLLAAGEAPEKIHNVSLGIGSDAVECQEDIFSNLAKVGKPASFFKNFTLGTVATATDRRRLEILLQVVKNCSQFIPNLRLVVIGDLGDNANLNWLVRKMGLERRVWLVGAQKKLLSWLVDFDLFISLAENPGLVELEILLLASANGLPLIGFPGKNLSEIIIAGETGAIISREGADEMTRLILEIEPDQVSRQRWGEGARRLVNGHFRREKQLERLKDLMI